MPAFTVSVDTVIHVFNRPQDTRIGSRSTYADKEHPGTNKKVEGWKWDGRSWPIDGEARGVAFSPSLWDPTISGIEAALFQSGYGDNDDLLLLDIEEVSPSGLDVWAPRLQHGFFYTNNEEWYLFSDSYLTQYFTLSGLDAGNQVLTMSGFNKPTIPIQIRNWRFNPFSATHEINLDFRKKTSFTVGSLEPEFILDTSFSPPQLKINGSYNETIGKHIVTTVSGVADANDIAELEQLGISDGNENQAFFTTFSPVDQSQSVEVWTWSDATLPTQWTVIDPVIEFTVSGNDVKVDQDRGTVQFGDAHFGNIPSAGHRIGVYYTTAIAAQFEPKDTQDDILAYSAAANVNPIGSSASKGFVQVTTESVDPASITLTSSLPRVNPFIIQLGNNIGEIIAEVKNAAGQLLEGQNVTFEILEPEVGTFGATATTARALTGSDGQATTLYNSPVTTEGLGQATVDVVQSGGNTIVEIAGVIEPAAVTDIFIYRVHITDEVLGIPEADEASYYTTYLSDIDTTTGIQSTTAFEQSYRTNHDLLVPKTYTTAEIAKGKKTMLLTTRSETMNPHTGFIEPGVLVPLHPDTIQNIGTVESPILRLTYSGLLDLPGTSDTKAYFLVGDTQTSLRAFVTNQRTNKVVFSNSIDLQIQIPDSLNGTFFCSTLNDIPDGLLTVHKNVDAIPTANINATSGLDDFQRAYLDERIYVPASGIFEFYAEWFRRAKRSDTVALTLAAIQMPDPTLSGLDIVTPVDCPSEIPMGFRLKSTGITVASVLNQVTYLDPNDILPSGQFLL